MHILIIEDDAVSRTNLRQALGKAGITSEISTTRSVKEACEWTDKVEYDLVFLDLHLGGKASMKALKAFRTYAPLLPIIAMVRFELEKYAKKCFDLGAQECMTIHQLWTLPLFPLVDSAIHRQAYLNKMLEPVQ